MPSNAYVNVSIISQQVCTNWSLSPSTQSGVPYTGNSYNCYVYATGTGCSYNVSTSYSWLHPINYSGYFTYSVDANPGSQRTGTISVNDVTDGISNITFLTVTQDAFSSSCKYTLSNYNQSYDQTNHSDFFTVNTNSSCQWSATSSDDTWLHTNSSGNGPGTCSYIVDANTGGDRTGYIYVQDQTFKVFQSGSSSCSYVLSKNNNSVDASGGNFSVDVTTQSVCSWTASSNDSWITVAGGSSGTGNGTVSYSVDSYTGTDTRTGTMTIANKAFTVTQSGTGVTATYWVGAYCDPESHHDLASGILAEATSYTPPAFPLKVCADGSDATVIQLNCDDKSLDMTKIRFRLVSDQNETNINLYGGFNNTYTSTNTLAETRLTHPNYLDNSNGSSRNDKIQAYSIDDPQKKTIIELPIIVYRAPMLFVHGLWGDAGSFKNMDEYFQNQFGINIATFRADYKASNGNSFASNYFVILDNWRSAMAHAISLRFSCGKMDVIAHSMGGVLSRLFLQSHTYKGEIHTLTTINTPHSGTQAANLLLSNLGTNTSDALNTFGYCVSCGAVKDLEYNSSYFQNNLNGNLIKIPSLTYTSFDDIPEKSNTSWIPVYMTYANNVNFFKSVGLDVGFDANKGAYELDTSLYTQKLNDAIVPLSSQTGNVSNFDMAQEITHTDAESNKNIFDDLKNKLGQNPASYPFNNNGFASANLSMPAWFYNPRVIPDVNKILASDSVVISSPLNNDIYNAGDTAVINIKNLAQEHSFTGCLIRDQDSLLYNNFLDDTTMTIRYAIPKNVYGKLSILAYGIEDNKPIYYDSIFVFVNTNAKLDSLKFEHTTIYISLDNNQSFSINGYYSDGVIRNVTNSSDINYNILDQSVLSIDNNDFLHGLKDGTTKVIAAMEGFVDTLNVVVYDTPNAAYSAFTTNTNVVCGNGQIQFNEETAGNILNRQWSFPGGSPSNSTDQNPIINYYLPGNYDVQLITTWADKKDTLLVPAYIKVQPAINAQINVSGGQNICTGDSAELSTNNAAYYFWSSGENTQSIYVKNAGDYYVTAVDSFGCSAISNTINVTVNPKPITKIIASSVTTFCQGNSVTLSASDTTNSYAWSNGSTAQSINANTTGVYKLISTNQYSCSNQDSVIVTVNPLPNINAGNNSTILFGDSIIVGGNPTASGNAPFTYKWQPSTALSSSTVANPIASPDSTTIYSVNVTDKNSCLSTDSVVVNIVKCTYSLSDSSYQFDINGGQHTINIITNSTLCKWQVTNSNDWVHITPTNTQAGSGSITMSVDSCFEDSARAGTFTVAGYTYTISQQCQKPGLDFKVYPNPTNGKVIITGNIVENNDYTITITDMLGKKLENYSVPVSNHQLYKEVNLHAYSSGLYLIQIQSTDFKKVYKIEKF